MGHNSQRIDAGGWSPDSDVEQADWLKPRWAYAHDVDQFLASKNISHPLSTSQREALIEMLADRTRGRTPDDLDRELARILG